MASRFDNDHIRCVGSDEAEITRLRMSDGGIVAGIVLDKANDPWGHGLDIKDCVLWYCDASQGWLQSDLEQQKPGGRIWIAAL